LLGGGSREPVNSETHTVLLGTGVWVIEELRFPPEALRLAPPVNFLALPIHLSNHSGAFCRPVLIVDSQPARH